MVPVADSITGSCAAARCRRCAWAVAGLVLSADGSGEFEHRDPAGCAEAKRIMDELGHDGETLL